ncbi:Shufflon-specific DNA recombinase [Candidatus Paraburkholderia kirkii]|nr:Shufflon-specific DNA recombinase [Candidatus Paraburkholderia kirkii]
MVRGVFIQRASSEKTTVADALGRYEREIVLTKKASTQRREGARIRELKEHFGKYSLAAVTPDLVSQYRDNRLAQGKANNTVRLELALLGHLFNVAIKEWHIGLIFNPVSNIRKPSPGEGRNRRLSGREQATLLAAVDEHTNPMLGWIVRLAIDQHAAIRDTWSTPRSDRFGAPRRATHGHQEQCRPHCAADQARSISLQSALANPIRLIDTDLVFFGEPARDKKRRAYQFTKVWNGIKKRTGWSISAFTICVTRPLAASSNPA